VGSRVGAKQKAERRDALSGLGQIYYRHYTQKKLQLIQQAGDDCDLDIIRSVLHDNCRLDDRDGRGRRRRHPQTSASRSRQTKNRNVHDEMDFDDDDDNGDCDDAEEEKYGWIPRTVFDSACYSDQADPDMRSRVFQIMDDMLLGSDLASTSSSKKMTPTAKAVGLAMIVDSLRNGGENLLTEDGSSNALKHLIQLWKQRASLQKTLSAYIDARAKIRECASGTFRSVVFILFGYVLFYRGQLNKNGEIVKGQCQNSHISLVVSFFFSIFRIGGGFGSGRKSHGYIGRCRVFDGAGYGFEIQDGRFESISRGSRQTHLSYLGHHY
jgi:hypothetical protein